MNFSSAPQFSPKNPPQWAEDHRSILQMICQQVEALKVNDFVKLNNFVTMFNADQLILLL